MAIVSQQGFAECIFCLLLSQCFTLFFFLTVYTIFRFECKFCAETSVQRIKPFNISRILHRVSNYQSCLSQGLIVDLWSCQVKGKRNRFIASYDLTWFSVWHEYLIQYRHNFFSHFEKQDVRAFHADEHLGIFTRSHMGARASTQKDRVNLGRKCTYAVFGLNWVANPFDVEVAWKAIVLWFPWMLWHQSSLVS